ncbi:hypothetical protein FO519_001603 [Halicephalobus sp. NKZ332]|nr:hypothetical protein FO519_001603 [Halicephalobus sp. NKZ332]
MKVRFRTSPLALLRDQFASFCRIRTPISGRISASGKFLNVTSSWTFRAPVMKKNLKVNQVALVNSEDLGVVSLIDSPPVESEGQAVVYSSDGKLSAVFSVITEEKNKKYFVRIVDTTKNTDINIFNLTAKKAHGNVHLSGDFEKYVWKESFGEQIFEVVDPVLCLLTVETGEVKILDSVPKNLFPVQKIFSEDEKFVIFSAVDAPHYKLGKVFCSNRHYSIGQINIQGNDFEIVAEKMSGVDYLKLSPDGVIFVFARTGDHQSHQGSYSIYKVNIPERDVEKIKTKEIFLPVLPERVFTNSGKIIFTSFSACCFKIYSFDIGTSNIEVLSPEDVSDVVLDVWKNYILVQRSSPIQTPFLILGKIENGKVNWTEICKPDSYEVKNLCFDVGFHENIGAHSFLLLPRDAPKESKSVPLVAILHGGPHAASFKSWPRRTIPMLLSAGYGVLQVNYPGSIGYDENYVQELPGKVGKLDVEFCEKVIDETISKFDQLDGNKVAIVGGSHGGFLVTHLAGKSPEKYKAVVALNPVINIRTMFDITDIPDWCAFETYSKPLPTGPMAGEAHAEMVAKSPIVNAHRIRAPYLLCIGGKDLRVPPHFRTLVRELRVNGVKNKVLYYPESNHALDEVEVEADVVINSILWIKENCH